MAGELLGVVEQADGLVAVGALVPLGRLSRVQMKVLESADRLIMTPWRGVVVPDLTPAAAQTWTDRLIAAGLPTAADSPWAGVTACAGRPGCAKSQADVRADAAATSRHTRGLPVHWAGCDRACGSPAGPHVQVRATPAGYVVTRLAGSAVPAPRPGGGSADPALGRGGGSADPVTGRVGGSADPAAGPGGGSVGGVDGPGGGSSGDSGPVEGARDLGDVISAARRA